MWCAWACNLTRFTGSAPPRCCGMHALGQTPSLLLQWRTVVSVLAELCYGGVSAADMRLGAQAAEAWVMAGHAVC
jgi:hypothetical protein